MGRHGRHPVAGGAGGQVTAREADGPNSPAPEAARHRAVEAPGSGSLPVLQPDAGTLAGVQRTWVGSSAISGSRTRARRGRTASVRAAGGFRLPALNCCGQSAPGPR